MSNNDIRSRVRAISERLPDQAQDEYYDTPEARIDTIMGKDSTYYLRLRAVKQEWDQRWKSGIRDATGVARDASFSQYLKEMYGIEMTIQPEGVDLKYRILDEQKHTLFLLKFGG
jgi:hypothetical protein